MTKEQRIALTARTIVNVLELNCGISYDMKELVVETHIGELLRKLAAEPEVVPFRDFSEMLQVLGRDKMIIRDMAKVS